MKDLALKIFRNAKVRAAFIALVLAIAAALGLNGSGCTPSQLEKADSALEFAAQARCAKQAAQDFDLLAHPELAALDEAPAIAARLKACFGSAPAADAGAR